MRYGGDPYQEVDCTGLPFYLESVYGMETWGTYDARLNRREVVLQVTGVEDRMGCDDRGCLEKQSGLW